MAKRPVPKYDFKAFGAFLPYFLYSFLDTVSNIFQDGKASIPPLIEYMQCGIIDSVINTEKREKLCG